MIPGSVSTARTCALAMLLACGHLGAHAEDHASKKLQQCMDGVDLGAVKNSQWARCYSEELARQDARLNGTFRLVLRTVPAEAKDALVKAQKSWIGFRDSWCGYEAALPNAPSGEVNRLSCLVDLTATQEERLRESAL